MYDVFISHASEDKTDFVTPLAKLLKRLGVKVWFDEFTIKPGDSLTRAIDRGLMQSRHGIVVLSKAFMQKPWPEYELRGLVAKEMGEEKVIIPIWCDVTRSDILKYSPSLADKFALSASHSSLPELAFRLLEVIRPDIYTTLHRKLVLDRLVSETETRVARLEDLKQAPVRHPPLGRDIWVRAKLICHAFSDTIGFDVREFAMNLRRDIDPAKELHLWEGLAAAFLDFTQTRDLSVDERREVAELLLSLSVGLIESEEDLAQFRKLGRERALDVMNALARVAAGQLDSDPA